VFANHELEGVSIQSLLYGAKAHDPDAQAFEEWRKMAFEVAPETWSDLAELAPREASLDTDGGSVPLELEFRPVSKDGALDRVMMLATDVSEKRRLERAVATQEEEHAKRMAQMRKLLAGGAQLFVAFIDTAREHVTRFSTRLADGRPLGRTEVDDWFRHVHTMKGESRAFDLRELE
jgi:hypothetical protein